MARAAPSGSRGDACGEEPRTRGAVAPAECQGSVWLFTVCIKRGQGQRGEPKGQESAKVRDLRICLVGDVEHMAGQPIAHEAPQAVSPVLWAGPHLEDL